MWPTRIYKGTFSQPIYTVQLSWNEVCLAIQQINTKIIHNIWAKGSHIILQH